MGLGFRRFCFLGLGFRAYKGSRQHYEDVVRTGGICISSSVQDLI